MYFIPLTQPESVALVIHALRAAGGTLDCRSCPVRKACEKQCLTIADAVERMFESQTLPTLDVEPTEPPPPAPASGGKASGGLRLVK